MNKMTGYGDPVVFLPALDSPGLLYSKEGEGMTHVRNYCEQYRSGITGNIREHLPQVIMWQYSRTSSQYLMTTCVLMWQYSRTRMYLVREFSPLVMW